MGLVNKLANMFGAGAVMETIREKDPAMIEFIDSLDEVSGSECIARMIHARLLLAYALPTKPINIHETQINWSKYIERFLTEVPAINVVIDLMNEFGFSEIVGINVNEFVKNLALYEDGH